MTSANNMQNMEITNKSWGSKYNRDQTIVSKKCYCLEVGLNWSLPTKSEKQIWTSDHRFYKYIKLFQA